LGNAEIQFLLELYANLFDQLDIHYQIDKKQQSLKAEGYNLSQLMVGEQGLQLFYTAHQNPIPIRLSLFVNDQKMGTDHPYQVIRLFDSQQIMTDLRTGFINVAAINPEEFKILVFAGLTKPLRQFLFR